MDARTQAGQTAGMETKTKTVEELLAQARDISVNTLGCAPDTIVAEVFRQLCLEREYGQAQSDGQPSPLH